MISRMNEVGLKDYTTVRHAANGCAVIHVLFDAGSRVLFSKCSNCPLHLVGHYSAIFYGRLPLIRSLNFSVGCSFSPRNFTIFSLYTGFLDTISWKRYMYIPQGIKTSVILQRLMVASCKIRYTLPSPSPPIRWTFLSYIRTSNPLPRLSLKRKRDDDRWHCAKVYSSI